MLLDVKNLSIEYQGKPTVEAVSFSLAPGEILAIVGESGSGKTTVIRAILGCLSGSGRVSGGEIDFAGRQLLAMSNKEWLEIRGRDMAMIFQDSGNMLNPVQTIGKQFVEYIRLHSELSKGEAAEKACGLLKRMNLPDPARVMDSYAFELSGGMRQRVGIAMGMTYQPKLLLADEPTSALDVTTQAQIVRQMMELRDEYGTSIIVVTHDIGVAAYMADNLVVMKDGRIEDQGARAYILNESTNAYTRKLIGAVPSLGGKRYV
jgi:peptide/nickel transport system ATP-binding protein